MSDSNPPSSRPMTLRQQLEVDSFRQFLRERVSNISTAAEDDIVKLVATTCQEIAREARLDELKQLPITEDDLGWAVGAEYIEERIAELTQKPPNQQKG